MMRCPLPIDWLEYLEGTGSDALISHLPECRPCQILVDELRRDRRPQLRPAAVPISASWPRWIEQRTASPSFGEIWWAKPPKVDGRPTIRVLVLLMSEVWHDKGRSWCDAAPVSTDIENATSLDLVLLRTDTEMDIPWRVVLRQQTVIDVHCLDARIGILTGSGKTVVRNALEGRVPSDRFGSPIEGPNDPRARLSADADEAVRSLGEAYAGVLESGGRDRTSHRILTFQLKQSIRSRVEPRELSLAAATTQSEEASSWDVSIPERGRLAGRVEYKLFEDELLFVIDEVEEERRGLGSPAWIAFWSERREEPVTSDRFYPTTAKQVSLGRGLGVFPPEIRRLELRLIDEE